jgi:hypothetical protein
VVAGPAGALRHGAQPATELGFEVLPLRLHPSLELRRLIQKEAVGERPSIHLGGGVPVAGRRRLAEGVQVGRDHLAVEANARAGGHQQIGGV